MREARSTATRSRLQDIRAEADLGTPLPESRHGSEGCDPLGEKVSEVRDPLLDVLNVPDRDTSLGAAAARALGAVKELATRAALATALECGPVVVRLAAVEILEMLGSDEEVVRLAAVVEAVNDREKIQRVLPRVREVLDRSLITLADVEIRMSPNSPVGPMGTSPARKSRAP